MRDAFFKTLVEIAESDQRIMFLTGDLGFGAVNEFVKRCPRQFLNVGVAEQNMTGIAAGLAMAGKTVFTYSIANFPTLRCLEQIRNDVCYHNADVKVVSVGGGLAYGALGPSHHATEDLGILRMLPNMTVVAPADPVEVSRAVRALATMSGPAYLRLGRVGERKLHSESIEFTLGRAIQVRSGADVTLISTGGMLEMVLEAANQLLLSGIDARVLSMHTIRPIDELAIKSAAAETRAIVTIEEHSVIGGLGSAVAEVLAGLDTSTRLRRVGLPSQFMSSVGSHEYLRERSGLSVVQIHKTVVEALTVLRSAAAF